MDTFLNIIAFVTSFLLEFTIVVITIASFTQYRKLEPKSLKALIGLVSIIVAWLASLVYVAVVHISYDSFLSKGGLVVFLFIAFMVQTIYQWTLAPISSSSQYMSRRIMTGAVILIGIIMISIFFVLRMKASA